MTSMQRIDTKTEDAVRRFLARIGDRYGVAGVIVYGSRVRGGHPRLPTADLDG